MKGKVYDHIYSVVFFLPRFHLHIFFLFPFMLNKDCLLSIGKDSLSGSDTVDIEGIWLVEELKDLASTVVEVMLASGYIEYQWRTMYIYAKSLVLTK